LTGGGTGGHVIPNLAVIEGLKSKGENDILYIGSKNGVEKNIVVKAGIRYEGVNCGKLRRYFSFENFIDILKIPFGYFEAKSLIKSFSPNLVFSKGGYVSVPVVLAASRLKIPVIVHESDVSPGLANKICFKFADKICLSFFESKSYLSKKYEKKIVLTGPPVRVNVLNGNADDGYEFTGLDRHRPVILIMGGSQGAMQINGLVRSSLDELLKRFQIVHIVGKGNLDIGVHKKGYVQYEFLEDQLKNVYAMSEMVVSRGGANSLCELALLNKKVLIIPIGLEASRGEQTNNAHYFVKNFCWSMISGDISREDFISNVELTFLNDPNKDFKLKNGLDDILKLIFQYNNFKK
jgi:UDP-N-acetylglucosamine--N-acetylmuramyl-(pentapeptide) pyrophosphoryl-undecaprenol N-acetylglucosamine transferase